MPGRKHISMHIFLFLNTHFAKLRWLTFQLKVVNLPDQEGPSSESLQVPHCTVEGRVEGDRTSAGRGGEGSYHGPEKSPCRLPTYGFSNLKHDVVSVATQS